MDNAYEQTIGPINRGFVKPISLELQDTLREIERLNGLDEIWATLTVCHPSAEPGFISDQLQLTPTNVSRIGDTVYKNKKHHIVAESTWWKLSTQGAVSSRLSEHHVDWLLEKLFGKLPSIRSLQNSGGEFRICVQVRAWSNVIGHSVSLEQMQQLARLRIPLELTIVYQNTDDEY